MVSSNNDFLLVDPPACLSWPSLLEPAVGAAPAAAAVGRGGALPALLLLSTALEPGIGEVEVELLLLLLANLALSDAKLLLLDMDDEDNALGIPQENNEGLQSAVGKTDVAFLL